MPIASTALPRSSQARTAATPSGWQAATVRAFTSTAVAGSRADIDAHDTASGRLDASRQIGKLLALRIGRADHVDPLHFSSATADLPPPHSHFWATDQPLQFYETRVS